MADFESVALLVDGDNFDKAHAETITKEARKLGNLTVRRVYCNARGQHKWDNDPNFRTIHAGSGKNASDLLLAIDAIELALVDNVEAFVLASSDADFSHLAFRLRELGKFVRWCGEDGKAAKGLSGFWCYKVLESASKQPDRSDDEIHAAIAEVIKEFGNEDGWVTLVTLGQKMKQLHGITKDDTKPKSWGKYVASFESFETTETAVRLKK